MRVFVLRDEKGKYVDHNVDIGPLFDSAGLFESKTGQIARISGEDFAAVLREIKENSKNFG